MNKDKVKVVVDNEQPGCSKNLPSVNFEALEPPEPPRTEAPQNKAPSPDTQSSSREKQPHAAMEVEFISEISRADSDGSDDSNTSTVTIVRSDATNTPTANRTIDDETVETVTFHGVTDDAQFGQSTEYCASSDNRQYLEAFQGAFGSLNVGREGELQRNWSPHQQYAHTVGMKHPYSTPYPTTSYPPSPINPGVNNPQNHPMEYANVPGMQLPNTTNYMGYPQNSGVNIPMNPLGVENREPEEKACKGHEVYTFLKNCVHGLNLAFTTSPQTPKLTSCLNYLDQMTKIIDDGEERYDRDFFRNEHKNHSSAFCDVARMENKEKRQARKSRKHKKARKSQQGVPESQNQQD